MPGAGLSGLWRITTELFQYRSRYRTSSPRLEIEKDREVINMIDNIDRVQEGL